MVTTIRNKLLEMVGKPIVITSHEGGIGIYGSDNSQNHITEVGEDCFLTKWNAIYSISKIVEIDRV